MTSRTRILLALVGCIAVAVAVLSTLAYRQLRYRAALERVDSGNGIMEYFPESESELTVFGVRIWPLKETKRPKWARFDTNKSEFALSDVWELTSISNVNLDNVSDKKALAEIVRLRHLESVSFTNCPVDPEVLSWLPDSLTSLSFTQCTLEEEDFKALSRFADLKLLFFFDVVYDPPSLARLSELPSLESLMISHLPAGSIDQWVSGLRSDSLEKLICWGPLADAGKLATALANCPRLQWLELELTESVGTAFSDPIPFANLHSLTSVNLKLNRKLDRQLSPGALTALSRLPNFRLLWISDAILPAGAETDFGFLSRLEELWMTNCQVSPEFVTGLAKAVELKRLEMSNTNTDNAALLTAINLPKIEEIKARGTEANADFILELTERPRPTLRELRLDFLREFDPNIRLLAKRLPGVTMRQDYRLIELTDE